VVIYGHAEKPETVSVDRHEFDVALAHGARTLALEVEGSTLQYLIKEVQYDHLGIQPIHIDLMRVDVDERVRVSVQVELRGVPKGVTEGGTLDQLLSEVEIECLALAIPEKLQMLVSHLGIGEFLYVKDLELPDGVSALTDGDHPVATVRVLVEEEAPEEVEAGEEKGGEPERIGRVRADESEEGKS